MCIRDRDELAAFYPLLGDALKRNFAGWRTWFLSADVRFPNCLLYTSDAADERSSVDLGGRRIIKKKKNNETKWIARI